VQTQEDNAMAPNEITVQTVTVLGSQALAQPDGRCGILLETRELGLIAFEVNQQAIDALRQNLAEAEQMFRHPPAGS
jgi:hypothetical protein